MEIIKKISEKYLKKALPTFKVGDVVDVHVKIKEGEKERIQVFTGTVIKIKGGKGISGSFTVRRIVQGEGVERIFPFHSPAVEDVQVRRPGRVRRAKLYYLRERVGKATKVKERRDVIVAGEEEGEPGAAQGSVKVEPKVERKVEQTVG
ncbi:MAG: 50S ribosomal protein L19 [Planctomycetes bacterium]|nr:50S ribosomal protein L19 [Planctomycetota bacterium]